MFSSNSVDYYYKEPCLNGYQQEGARIERITEYEEHVGMPSKNINAGADKRERSVDKMLCKTRVSRAVIAGTYRGLVASIAAAYLGKGLTLQDLIQVPTYIYMCVCVTLYSFFFFFCINGIFTYAVNVTLTGRDHWAASRSRKI